MCSLSYKSSRIYFLKRQTCVCACGCACGTIIFWKLRKRLRRKNFRVIGRALAAQLLLLAQPTSVYSGVYLGGGIVPWPPLWVARNAKLHRKVSKIEAWPPLCKFGIRFDHTKGMFCAFLLDFGLQIGLNLTKAPFFLLFS